MKTLADRIEAALIVALPQHGPGAAAPMLLDTMSREERKALLLRGAEDTIRGHIRNRRRISIPGTGSIDWPSNTKLTAFVDEVGTISEAARQLGVGHQTLKKRLERCDGSKVMRRKDEIDQRCMERVSASIGEITATYMEALNAGTLNIDTATRVSVDGHWTTLGDCDSTNLRWLADDRLNGAMHDLNRTAYYTALADGLDASQLPTVRHLTQRRMAA